MWLWVKGLLFPGSENEQLIGAYLTDNNSIN